MNRKCIPSSSHRIGVRVELAKAGEVDVNGDFALATGRAMVIDGHKNTKTFFGALFSPRIQPPFQPHPVLRASSHTLSQPSLILISPFTPPPLSP
jgi:hypothetical protein